MLMNLFKIAIVQAEFFKRTPVFQTIHKVINGLLNNFVYRPNYHFRTAITFWKNKSY